MKFLAKSKQEEIEKLIACCRYMAEMGMISNVTYEKRLEYMVKIIENLAEISFEIGGKDFTDAVSRHVARLHANFWRGY